MSGSAAGGAGGSVWWTLSFLVLLLTLAACSGRGSPAPPTQAAPTIATTPSPGPGRVSASASPATEPVATTARSATTPGAAAAASPALASVSLSLLGSNDLGGGGYNADVFAFKGFAYVGSYGYGGVCPATGVRIVDVSDPTQPRLVATAAAIPGTSQEKVIVRHVSTAQFSGDLLAVGVQRCGEAGRGGVSLYDVSDPRNPVSLGFFATGPARGVHELDLVQQGSRALALLAVPYSEQTNGVGDFRIVDVSDPRNPVQLAAWGAGKALGVDLQGGIGCLPQVFDHSARASADGSRVYLSYWDAGVIILDIRDPVHPQLLGRIQYGPDEEGETHSVAEADGGRYLLVTDESGIFGPPPALHFTVQTAAGTRTLYGCEALFSAQLDTVGRVQGRIADVGDGCPGSRLAADPAGAIALADAGGCSVEAKAQRLAAAGALAVVTATSADPVAEEGGTAVGIPVVTVRITDAAGLKQALNGAAGSAVLPSEKHSGGMRIWDIGDPAHPRQVAVFQSPASAAFPPPGNGWYTAHNAEVEGNLAFVSWYADGVQVVDISNPAAPRLIAAYRPPAQPNPLRATFPNGTNVWGVALMGDLALLSDTNSGLYVLRVQRSD